MDANLNWLEDPEVFQVNRLDAHSDHICYASEEERAGETTSLRQSLDGVWQFHWSENPGTRPASFWQPGFDDSAFGSIRVPGHMELQGYGKIQYINTLYPWDGQADIRPPKIDWARNYVGSYVRCFDLEPGLRGKEVCISFQGVERAFFLWLNGHFVGYGEDSFTPSDFDLTPYIRETGNRLCVEVYRYSSAAWLEDQDFFRFSGIFRSVFLYARPRVHLEDLWLQTGLEEDLSTGTLRIRMKLSGEAGSISCRIAGLLAEELQLHYDGTYYWSQKFTFPNVRPWCHEDPALYDLVLTLADSRGQIQEIVPYAIGFCRFEMKNKIMTLNGQRLVIRGVNRHEWNPQTGRAIGREDMEAAADTILRNHINAVRTSHYPNQTQWYGICDARGIYLMDETNLETHGSWQKLGRVEPSWNVPGSLPQWRDCVLDRARNMFERDKNHVSILFWSCGNESYAGENIAAMADYFRSQDPSRMVHYEGVFHNRAFDRISDMESRMYAPPDDIRAYLENDPEKPFLLCEYMHDMGNSLGGMERYIRLEEEFPMYQGGFIWDYMDQALWMKNPQGHAVLGYGGDFDDRQTDYAFSGNGIVFADGTEKPAMQEVRWWYADREVQKALEQSNQTAAAAVAPLAYTPAALKTVHGDGALGVSGGDFEVLFSVPEGGPCSLLLHGKQWLWRAPRPAFWRCPTENDRGCGFDKASALWAGVEMGLVCSGLEILEESADAVSLRYTYTAAAMPGLKTQVTYTVSSGGWMDVDARYSGAENRPELPMFGLRFATPAPVDRITWTGLSGETYPDRKKGGMFGIHEETPHIPDYLVPQTCGCHMDTHRTALKMGEHQLTWEKKGEVYGFSAIPYTPFQLSQACHKWELPEPARTVVTVCGAMRGVGGIDSWGSDVEEAFRLPSDRDYTLSLRISLC